MPEKTLTIEQVLTLLTEAPPRIAEVTAGVAPDLLRTRPRQDEWSAVDVLAHVRSCADMWGGAIETIIEEDEPTIRAVNPRTWIDRTNYPDLQFRPSFRAFTKQRAQLLALPEPLPAEGWSRSATVTGAGAPLTRTVHSYAQWLATHERTHVKQIERIVNTMHI